MTVERQESVPATVSGGNDHGDVAAKQPLSPPKQDNADAKPNASNKKVTYTDQLTQSIRNANQMAHLYLCVYMCVPSPNPSISISVIHEYIPQTFTHLNVRVSYPVDDSLSLSLSLSFSLALPLFLSSIDSLHQRPIQSNVITRAYPAAVVQSPTACVVQPAIPLNFQFVPR